ncbi:hypothetical protein GCM10010872_32960 [Dyella flava]|nr:hypothetical protein GCM10010872_32960 [Dyella flava]
MEIRSWLPATGPALAALWRSAGMIQLIALSAIKADNATRELPMNPSPQLVIGHCPTLDSTESLDPFPRTHGQQLNHQRPVIAIKWGG